MGFHEYPYTDLYNLNLDWMLKIVKQYADTIDDIPAKVKEAVDKLGENIVLSVNGESGDVILYKDQYTRLPDIEDAENPVWNFYRKVNGIDTGLQFLNNGTVELIVGTSRYKFYTNKDAIVDSFNNRRGAVTLTASDVNNLRLTPVYNIVGTIDDYPPEQLANLYNMGYRFMVQRDATKPGFSVMYFIQISQSGVASATPLLTESGQTTTAYSPENPPPYPVTSVNGRTGAVQISYPVTSVNGQTGDVVIDVGSAGYRTTVTLTDTDTTEHSFQDFQVNEDMCVVSVEFDSLSGISSDTLEIDTYSGEFIVTASITQATEITINFMEV